MTIGATFYKSCAPGEAKAICRILSAKSCTFHGHYEKHWKLLFRRFKKLLIVLTNLRNVLLLFNILRQTTINHDQINTEIFL